MKQDLTSGPLFMHKGVLSMAAPASSYRAAAYYHQLVSVGFSLHKLLVSKIDVSVGVVGLQPSFPRQQD